MGGGRKKKKKKKKNVKPYMDICIQLVNKVTNMLDCKVCGQDLTPTFDKVKDHFLFFSSSESVLV